MLCVLVGIGAVMGSGPNVKNNIWVFRKKRSLIAIGNKGKLAAF